MPLVMNALRFISTISLLVVSMHSVVTSAEQRRTVPRIGSVDLRLERLKGWEQNRPCQDLEAVQIVLETKLAALGGFINEDVATTVMSCSESGITATVAFITEPGQILGVIASTMPVPKLSLAMSDPLGTLYSLSLVGVTPHMITTTPRQALSDEA